MALLVFEYEAHRRFTSPVLRLFSTVQAIRPESVVTNEERSEVDWAEVAPPESKTAITKPGYVVVLEGVAYTTYLSLIRTDCFLG